MVLPYDSMEITRRISADRKPMTEGRAFGTTATSYN